MFEDAEPRVIADPFNGALGEIVLFRGHLDLERVLPEIRRFANDPALAPFVEDSLDNIYAAKKRHSQLG